MKKYFFVIFAALSVAVLVQGTPLAQAADKASSAKTPQKKEAKYVASKETKTYHLASCKLTKEIKPEDEVRFSSKAAAAKAGYSPCSTCLK